MQRKKIDKLVQALTSWEEGLAHLGECVVQFQRIEDALSMCISAMIGRSRKVGEIVTSEMSFRARVSVFGALFVHSLRKASLPDDVVELLQRLHWAEHQRNILVHSLWDATESKPDSIRREKKAIRKRIFTVVTREEVVRFYVAYDRRKKGKSTPTDLASWLWDNPEELDSKLPKNGLKAGVLAAYKLWWFLELLLPDLLDCAIVNHIFKGQPQPLSLLFTRGVVETWKPNGYTEWVRLARARSLISASLGHDSASLGKE